MTTQAERETEIAHEDKAPLHIPLAEPDLGPLEERLVLETLRSGRLALGPRLGEFEESFARYVGASHAVAVSSGTAGLHLAVRAAGVGRGDEVITSPFSWVASANCVIYEGAKPVFVDVDPETFNIDPAAARSAVTERTKAILPVHIFGYPADMSALEAIAQRHGLSVIEDGCQALGAETPSGTRVGGSGNPTVFGFYPNKQITTGEGGMITTGSADQAALMRSERNHGRAPDMGWLDHRGLGFNYRIPEMSCALGVAQVGRVDELLADRARVAGWYLERLADLEELGFPCPDRDGNRRSWFVFVVQLPDRVDRDEVIRELGRRGIESKGYLSAIHLQPYQRELFGYGPGDFPVCEDLSRRSIALPFFGRMTEAQVDRVCSVFRSVIRGATP